MSILSRQHWDKKKELMKLHFRQIHIKKVCASPERIQAKKYGKSTSSAVRFKNKMTQFTSF